MSEHKTLDAVCIHCATPMDDRSPDPNYCTAFCARVDARRVTLARFGLLVFAAMLAATAIAVWVHHG